MGDKVSTTVAEQRMRAELHSVKEENARLAQRVNGFEARITALQNAHQTTQGLVAQNDDALSQRVAASEALIAKLQNANAELQQANTLSEAMATAMAREYHNLEQIVEKHLGGKVQNELAAMRRRGNESPRRGNGSRSGGSTPGYRALRGPSQRHDDLGQDTTHDSDGTTQQQRPAPSLSRSMAYASSSPDINTPLITEEDHDKIMSEVDIPTKLGRKRRRKDLPNIGESRAVFNEASTPRRITRSRAATSNEQDESTTEDDGEKLSSTLAELTVPTAGVATDPMADAGTTSVASGTLQQASPAPEQLVTQPVFTLIVEYDDGKGIVCTLRR